MVVVSIEAFNDIQATANDSFLPKQSGITGNNDHFSVATVEIEGDIVAKALRIWPKNWQGLPCLRLEIYGKEAGMVYFLYCDELKNLTPISMMDMINNLILQSVCSTLV